MEIIVFWLVCAVFCAMLASSKNRSATGWFFIGLLTSILGLFVIAVMPKKE